MKSPYIESLYRRIGQYHRHHQWRLEHGVYISHAYRDNSPPSLWDDVGFILNGRRIMIWWEHPRLRYADAITELAYKQAGDPPAQDTEDSIESYQKVYKKVGLSRKKVKYYKSSEFLGIHSKHYDQVNALERQMKQVGIDDIVEPSFTVQVLHWCKGVDLCAPLEIRSKDEIFILVALVRRLLKRETSLQREFPSYQYTKEDWLSG